MSTVHMYLYLYRYIYIYVFGCTVCARLYKHAIENAYHLNILPFLVELNRDILYV